MYLRTLFLAVLAASSVTAQRLCGTPNPIEEQVQIAQNLQIIESEASLPINSSRPAAAAININVYWHVNATSNAVNGGYLTPATLKKQLCVLNDAYAPHGISFTQAGAD